MPTPAETAAAVVAKIDAARTDSLTANAAVRAHAQAQMRPVTDILAALGAALDAKGNALGSIHQSFAVLRDRGRFASEYALSRADGHRRSLVLAFGPAPDKSESIWINGLGMDLVNAADGAGLPKGGPVLPVSDEISFNPKNAGAAAAILSDQIGVYFQGQGW